MYLHCVHVYAASTVASDKDEDNEDEEDDKDDKNGEDGEDGENEEDEEDRGSSDVDSNWQSQHGFGTYSSIIAENSWLKVWNLIMKLLHEVDE